MYTCTRLLSSISGSPNRRTRTEESVTYVPRIHKCVCSMVSNMASSRPDTWQRWDNQNPSGTWLYIYNGRHHKRKYFLSSICLCCSRHLKSNHFDMRTYWLTRRLTNTLCRRHEDSYIEHSRRRVSMCADSYTGAKSWSRRLYSLLYNDAVNTVGPCCTHLLLKKNKAEQIYTISKIKTYQPLML